MKLENQVCSLALSKKLQEIGVKQKSLFSWQINLDGNISLNISFMGSIGGNDIPAYTVGELGELLKSFEENIKNYELDFYTTYDTYNIVLKPTKALDAASFYSKDILEANARAKMLVHLIENHLMK